MAQKLIDISVGFKFVTMYREMGEPMTLANECALGSELRCYDNSCVCQEHRSEIISGKK